MDEESSKFECKRCKYVATCHRNLRSHLQRKKICIAKTDECDIPREDLIKDIDNLKNLKNYKCNFCDRRYSSNSSLLRHTRTCKKANEDITVSRKEFDDIKVMLARLQASQAPSIVINDNSVTNIMNNITFNDGGALLECDQRAIDTFYEHIPKEKRIELAKVKLDNIPTKLIGDIFFNEDRKENMILAVLSEKKDQASVYENGKWSRKDSARAVLTYVFQIMLQKIYEANDCIPRDQRVNKNLYELVQPHKINDITDEIVHFAHYNLYKVEKVHGNIPRE